MRARTLRTKELEAARIHERQRLARVARANSPERRVLWDLVRIARREPEIDRRDYGPSGERYYQKDLKTAIAGLPEIERLADQIESAGLAWIQAQIKAKKVRFAYGGVPYELHYVAGQNYNTEFRGAVLDLLQCAIKQDHVSSEGTN